MTNHAYNAKSAARVRAAKLILEDAALLDQFLAHGGLSSDLERVITLGETAKTANLGQSAKTGEASGAFADVGAAFSGLQRDYKAVMLIVQAVRADLLEGGAGPEVIEPIDRILRDETAVHIKTEKGEDDRKVRKALKSRSQEDVRAEIEKDALALHGNSDLAPGLAARRVEASRLAKLRDAAAALSGKLATTTAKKGERKQATAIENEAVRVLDKRWSVIAPLLAKIDDERVDALLTAARG